ncbi:MAG: dihydrofolate reductase [Burkholderiaceae bacterium]
MHPCDRPRLVLVAAVASNGCIGRQNDLPWHLPEDLQHFKSVTRGGTVLLGRKTYESIVQRLGRPLPGRYHLVLSRNTRWQPQPDHAQHVQTVQSIEQAIHLANERLADTLFVIGGAELYTATQDIADSAELTEVELLPEGDAFFPGWSPKGWENARLPNCKAGDWQLSKASGLRYRFLRYSKPKVNIKLGAAVLLAGDAKRFGGQPKGLLENQSGSILRQTVKALLSVGVDHVCLVHGGHAGALVPAVDGLEVEHLENPEPRKGQARSQQLGLIQLGDALDGYLICLGDQPLLDKEDLRRLICAFRKREPVVDMVYPESHDGKPGNPVIVTPELRHWFASQSQPVLGKDWRQSNPAKAAAFPTARPGFFVDIDSEDDLNAFNAGQKQEDRLAMPLGYTFQRSAAR